MPVQLIYPQIFSTFVPSKLERKIFCRLAQKNFLSSIAHLHGVKIYESLNVTEIISCIQKLGKMRQNQNCTSSSMRSGDKKYLCIFLNDTLFDSHVKTLLYEMTRNLICLNLTNCYINVILNTMGVEILFVATVRTQRVKLMELYSYCMWIEQKLR